jgi:hypothetical protein
LLQGDLYNGFVSFVVVIGSCCRDAGVSQFFSPRKAR